MPRQTGDSFADRLRRLQHERRITVDELARTSGISARLIQKYRAGVVEPRDIFGDPSENARKLASALGVPVEALLPSHSDDPDLQPAA